MINNDNIFSVEEYKPEQSTEGADAITNGIILSSAAIFIIANALRIRNDKVKMNRLKENLHILEEPLRNDFKKYTQLHKELTKNDTILKMLNNVDKNGTYKFVKNKSYCQNESFSIKNEKDFANDLMWRIRTVLNHMNRKTTQEDLKTLINDKTQYSYVISEGMPMIKLIQKFNNDHSNDTDDEDVLESKINRLYATFSKTCKDINSVCESMKNKGFDLTPIFYFVDATGYDDWDLSEILESIDKELDETIFCRKCYGDRALPARVEIRLNMPTSITPELFLKLKKAVDGK